jgi:hypothetical protein
MVHTYIPGSNIAFGAEPDNSAPSLGKLRAGLVVQTPAPSAQVVRYNEDVELDARLVARQVARWVHGACWQLFQPQAPARAQLQQSRHCRPPPMSPDPRFRAVNFSSVWVSCTTLPQASAWWQMAVRAPPVAGLTHPPRTACRRDPRRTHRLSSASTAHTLRTLRPPTEPVSLPGSTDASCQYFSWACLQLP